MGGCDGVGPSIGVFQWSSPDYLHVFYDRRMRSLFYLFLFMFTGGILRCLFLFV